MLWLVLQVPIQQGRHPRPRVWGHRYQRGVTGIINFLATLSAFRYFPFKIRKFRKKQKSVIELASLSVSSVSYLLGMNTKKAVHRNRKGNHWNSNIKLKEKKLLADDVLLESTNSMSTWYIWCSLKPTNSVNTWYIWCSLPWQRAVPRSSSLWTRHVTHHREFEEGDDEILILKTQTAKLWIAPQSSNCNQNYSKAT